MRISKDTVSMMEAMFKLWLMVLLLCLSFSYVANVWDDSLIRTYALISGCLLALFIAINVSKK